MTSETGDRPEAGSPKAGEAEEPRSGAPQASPAPGGARSRAGGAWARRLTWTLLVVLIVVAPLVAISMTVHGQERFGFLNRYHLERRFKAKPVRNVILIGWDGCLIDDIRQLLQIGRLPNLQRVIDEGRMIDTWITTSLTETKPGWAEILTGYGPTVTGVYDNRDKYRDIPKGLTIFERLKAHFGNDAIRTIFIAGKLQNLGNRGPHRVRIGGNRKTWHDETLWVEGEKGAGDVVWHEAEPYYTACKSCDVFKIGLGDAPFVGQALIDAIGETQGKRFFAFSHFWEPDEAGHDYGEGTAAYQKVIVENDDWLGKVVATLKKQGIYDETAIYIVTDHGFDKQTMSHHFAAHTWLVTNDVVTLVDKGDRKDVTPTLLQRFGIDWKSFQPPIHGHSLLK